MYEYEPRVDVEGNATEAYRDFQNYLSSHLCGFAWDFPSVKPDLPATLEQKDRKKREEVLCRVIGDAKKLVKSVDIPPVPLTAFENALLYFIMLAFLDFRHCEFFGIPEGKSVPEDIKLNLYGSLTDEQKNILKRDFLIENMVQGNGITKKTVLLIELAKRHFPDEMDEIENTHNEDT